MKRIFIILIIVLAILVAGIVSYAYFNVYLPREYQQEAVNYYNQQLEYYGYYGGGGMMGSGMMGQGGMYHMMGYYGGYTVMYEQTIPINEAISMMKNVPNYVKVFPENDTLVFNSTDITLVVLSMGHGRAINLTDYVPPSFAHAQDNVFVIYGLINPTIIIPQGAVVHIILINLDAGDYHNIAITPVPPPYPYYVMMYIKMNILGMAPMLPPANYNSGQAYTFSFTTTFSQTGTYYYLCEYPGHAEMGMYGEIIVR
ncbi:plastocyanin/azurin family copper-binding protein [Sulfurisphaera javensis]